MKKVITIMLCLVLVFGFSTVAYAEGTENVDYFVYQGEDYYKAQTENPAADLQPGEQIDIKLSDNSAFVSGIYKITVVSCGNRESFVIKKNEAEVGIISRVGTGFGMDQMTNDVLETTVELTSEDLLSVVGEAGQIYGWVDYIVLEKVGELADSSAPAEVVNEIPKTGEAAPIYLLPLLAISIVGMIVGQKMSKKVAAKN